MLTKKRGGRILDTRKEKILQAIISDYIESAEPVGSRTLARKYDLGVSPATIRNEMADLEMLGYLEQIHTSSGRIPSSKGYRFYVDGLLPSPPLTDKEKAWIDTWYKKRVKEIDEIFQETARLISQITHNMSLVLAVQKKKTTFRFLQFLPLDDRRVIAVLLTDAGFVENKIIHMPSGAIFEDFQRIAEVFNSLLTGYSIDNLPQSTIKLIRREISDESLFQCSMELLERSLGVSEKERLYLGGTTKMLEQPEFHDVEKVKELLLMIEEEEVLKDILHAHLGDGLSVTIGQENECTDIQNCSIITATYHLGGEVLGTLAVLGPTRMEYKKAITLLEYMNKHLADVIHKFRF